MSLASKILVGVIALATIGFAYLALKTLKVHDVWRTAYNRSTTQIDSLTEQNRQLVDGSPAGKGIRQLQSELHALLVNRGRVWYQCSPAQPDAQTGAVSVTIDLPDPHKIEAATVLQVFEQPADANSPSGSYLGEFRVKAAEGKRIDLEPALALSPDESKRLAASRGPWALHEVMPADAHDIFPNETPEQKEFITARLPERSRSEYLRDAQAAAPDDPPERVRDGDDGKKYYERKLRDYGVLLREVHRRRAVRQDAIAAGERDNAALQAALADSQKQIEFRRQEKAGLEEALALARRERDAVTKHREALGEELARVERSIQEKLAENARLAEEIATFQRNPSTPADQIGASPVAPTP